MSYAHAALAAFQVVSGYQQAEGIREQANLNQRIGDMNAKYADMDAWEAEKFGYTESARYQNVIDSTISEQRVGLAAKGVDISTGTAKALQDENRLTGMLNILDIQKMARQKAMGFKVQASNLRLGGQMGQYQANINASAARNTGVLNAASTGLDYYKGQG